MDHLRANLATLAQSNPELARRLEDEPSDRVEILTSAVGAPTAKLHRSGGQTLLLHSQYDPVKEARAVLRCHDLTGADYFVLLGFGLGYILDAIAETSWGPDTRVFVVESNLSILRAAFGCRSMESLLHRPNLRFAWPTTGPAIAEQWTDLFDPVTARKSVFIPCVPSVALCPDFYRSAAEVIQSQTSQVFTDINTLVSRSEIFLENFVQNASAISRAPGVTSLKGKFRGTPGVIVSAGPSLDCNIHELRGFPDRVLILATDTAVKPLLSAGLEPHFICTADPSEVNYRHLEGARTSRSLLVAEATSHPKAISDFSGQLLACTFEHSALHGLSGIVGQKGNLRAWGSVATMVLDFALFLGCDPVVFIGQDLAYSEGRTYCSGVHFEHAWFQGVTDSVGWRSRLDTLVSQKKLVTMTDVFGREVQTTVTLASYWNWFLKEIHARPDVRFVNATEGGILREGVEIMSLREALFRFCRERRGHRCIIEEIRANAAKPERGPDTAFVSLLLDQCAHVDAATRRGARAAEKSTTRSAADRLREFEEVKESIYGCRDIAPLIDSFNQMGNVTFLRGRAALRGAGGEGAVTALSTLYREYFRSVREANQKLQAAFERIVSESERACDLVAARD